MNIKIVTGRISRQEIKLLAQETYKEMVKAVVDIEKETLAVGGELHADAESVLLDNGSRQEDLWGINLYPDKRESDRIAYTSLINIRPTQGNNSMSVQEDSLKDKIKNIVEKRVVWE